ncbi:MAG: carboxylating nicotinate-nucleotide diphosphorylase [Bacteroidetes bacterium]|nr:carboxylating nicotinate-nucleotide diphosphorylase [Bacteroidota bacterium]
MESFSFHSAYIHDFIQRALAEDIGDGDHSAMAAISPEAKGAAYILYKEAGIVAGLELAAGILHTLDPEARLEVIVPDGTLVEPGTRVATARGSVRSLLGAERLILNCMQRLSGIASTTAKAVEAVKPYPVKLLDTRKTTPGLRPLEKWAVTLGGGYNHRFGLFDMIMLKDNHIDHAGGISKAIKKTLDYLQRSGRNLAIEVEARNLQDVEEVLRFPEVQRVMFDNFHPDLVKEGVQLVAGRMETEASGGINMSNIRDYAPTGVDFISLGFLTHSVKSVDISMKTLLH